MFLHGPKQDHDKKQKSVHKSDSFPQFHFEQESRSPSPLQPLKEDCFSFESQQPNSQILSTHNVERAVERTSLSKSRSQSQLLNLFDVSTTELEGSNSG
eukprot:Pgem_evm1s5315